MVVRRRSGGRCEIEHPDCSGSAAHFHHRQLRSQGGPHTAENLMHLCALAHYEIHARPERAYGAGLVGAPGRGPDDRAVEITETISRPADKTRLQQVIFRKDHNMALPVDVCVGQRNVCLLRAARLDTDCSPMGGADQGIVTIGLVTMTASPEIEEGTVFEPKNGCGQIAFSVADQDIIKRYNLTGEILFHDIEMMYVLFGGTLIGGTALYSPSMVGKNVGWAAPGPNSAASNGVYLEVITQNVTEGAGDCSTGSTFPAYTGHIFGKAKLVPGDRTFENDVANVSFTGKAFQNPALFNGPWNDYKGLGYIPTSPYVTVYYTQADYNTILATAGCGFVSLPTAS